MGTAQLEAAATVRYRFADVVIEPHGRRVFVGARERAASRRAFDLLLTLCEAPGRVLSRDELSERLWPGGQIVSDEALTQAIFRARAVLGVAGERIVTVRGIGIRFDAEVQREALTEAASPVPAATSASVAVPALDTPPSPALASMPASPVEQASVEVSAAGNPPLVGAEAPVGQPLQGAAATGVHRDQRSDIALTAPTVHNRRATDRTAAPATGAAPARPRKRTLWLVPLALLLALALWRWPLSTTQWVDRGYGIRAADVHAAHPDSVRLLGEAIRYDNGGDRARARALLEALNDSDTQTPWPPLLLGLWAVGSGDSKVADTWIAHARERVAPLRDPYVNAMLRYTEAERDGSPQDIVRYAGAVLDLHPGAWRMQLARAHLKNYQGLREAALAEIREIEITELGNRKLETALADRASFGDVAGAQAVLDKLPRTTDAAAWEYLAGRIAWSRGDHAAARTHWERAAAEAQKNGRSDIGNRALANAGMVATLDNDRAAAIAHFERARVGMAAARWVIDEIDLSLLLAQLQMLDGNTAIARQEFQHAVEVGRRGGEGAVTSMIALVGVRLFPDLATGVQVEPMSAVQSLAAARGALANGDRVRAHAELEAARQRGVLDLGVADEARLLKAELGETVSPENPLDPPYPPLARAGTRLALQVLQGTASAAAGRREPKASAGSEKK